MLYMSCSIIFQSKVGDKIMSGREGVNTSFIPLFQCFDEGRKGLEKRRGLRNTCTFEFCIFVCFLFLSAKFF